MRGLFTFVLAACMPIGLQAEVKLASIFSDHAVLQRDKPLPIWGWANPGEEVTVSLGAQSARTKAGGDGKWQVELPGQAATGIALDLIISGSNTITRKDVLLGDVWLCSGQSNMDMGLGNCAVPDELRGADFPLIRHFRGEYHFAIAPADELKGQWAVCNPASAAGFSAVGYYFARRIHQETGVPIGLLTNAVGGTNIELWMCQETLLNHPALGDYAAVMRESLANYRRQLADALPEIETWTQQSRAALRDGKPVPLLPLTPDFPFIDKIARPRCVTLHNGMLSPLVPMALKGVLWYQGENNADGQLYVEKKAAMIADWRKWFRDPELPFYYVQLAAWQQPDPNPAGGGWGLIRDAQRRCLAIPHTGMASAVDLGDAVDIHPKNKADVGERLALWALRYQYDKAKLETSGPLFREMKIEGCKARILFDRAGGTLMVARKLGRNPVVETKDEPLKSFAIAGEDRVWHWADARIDGDTVMVSSPNVERPLAVRYAFQSNPEGANLYNSAGLPASPFRTDAW